MQQLAIGKIVPEQGKIRGKIKPVRDRTIAKIGPARGKIGVIQGQIRHKNVPNNAMTEDRMSAMNSKTTIPALTSGRTTRMQPSGARIGPIV